MRKIGVHLSISGGLYRALDKARDLKIQAVQIFLKNSNRWHAKPYSDEDIRKFAEARSRKPDISVFAHSGYLINLAGAGEIHKKSMRAMIDEMRRTAQLDIEYLVIHPGSHGGRGVDDGIGRVAESLNRVLEEEPHTGILLETTAGQGASIGCRFEELRRIIDAIVHANRLGVCLDTCHIFAAGYDISDKNTFDAVVSDFNTIIGLERLKLIHINDSKRECGSRVDRHEHIGKGRIGIGGFRLIVNDARLKPIPMILETPKFNDDEADRMNLKKISGLLK